MPYPFAPCPILAEFKQILEQEYDARFLVGPELKSKDDGPCQITYFERQVDGDTIQCVAIFEEGDDNEIRVDWHLVRSICARLKIDPARFGLTLG